MADSSPLPPPSTTTQPSSSSRSKTDTRLKAVAKRRNNGEKTLVDINIHTRVATGPNASSFQSYLGYITRNKISILIPHWEDVPEVRRNMLWQDILLTYDIPNSKTLCLKVMSSIAKKWRQFKSKLTRKYIFGPKKDISHCTKYRGLDQETWEKFVESRISAEWQERRTKAKVIQTNNECPHTLSCGEYRLLEEKMMDKKRKEREEAASSDPTALVTPHHRLHDMRNGRKHEKRK